MTRSPIAGCLMMAAVASCATTTEYVDRIVTVRPTVPPSLLHCKADPEPLGPGARQRDLPGFTLDQRAAAADCRRKLGTVAKIVGEQP